MNSWVVVRHMVAIAGRVMDAQTGNPIGGARVTITAGPPAFTTWLATRAKQYGKRWAAMAERPDRTRSAGDGHFHFMDLPDGPYTVSAELSDSGSRYGSVQQTTTVTRDAQGHVIMAAVELLMPPTTVKGRVNGPGATPVSMAEVRVSGGNERVFTDSQGKYVLTGLEVGERTLLVAAPGFRPASKTVTLSQAGDLATLNFALKPGAG